MIGEQMIVLKEVGSTNRYMLDMLEQDMLLEGTVVVARNQTAGRGLDRNTWESEPGKNLTFSFVVYPHFLKPSAQFYINKVISLALIDQIRKEVTDPGLVRIKWPNDLYFKDDKLAGILIQNGIKGDRIDFSVVGIGLNVNQLAFSEDIPNPISLGMITGKDHNLDQLLGRILSALQLRFNQLEQEQLEILDEEYVENLYRYQVPGQYIYKGETIQATIIGINHFGQLLLETRGGNILECDLKEVQFRPSH